MQRLRVRECDENLMCLICVNPHSTSLESVVWLYPFYNLVNIVIMIMTPYFYL